MKKIMIGFVLFLLAFSISGCNGKKDDRITISYAAWNLGLDTTYNLERRMIDAFEEEYPHIRVNVIERPMYVDEEGNEREEDWDAFFNAQAAIKKMPDVFQLSSVVKAITNDWVSDIYEIAMEDPDFLKIPVDIREAALYDGKLFGLPQALFYFGFFINRTIIERQVPSEDDIPTYGLTYEKLMDIAQKSAKPPHSGGDGIVGINGVDSLSYWLASQYDSSLGWFTYNEEGYHLNSEAFKIAITEQKKYFSEPAAYVGYVLESANTRFAQTQNPGHDPNLLFGPGDKFTSAHQAIKWEGSYNLRDWIAATVDEESYLPGLFGQDIDFIGTPSVIVEGEKNHRIPVVLDYLGIGKGTEHLEEAFLFAKWMGFGVDGYRKRLEIARLHPEAGAVNFAPMVQDENLIDEYFTLYPTLVEFKKIVTTHNDFIIESLGKTVPGYVKSRWEGAYDENDNIANILDKIRDGDINFDDVANNLNDLANTYYNEAKEELEDALSD